MFQQVLHHRQQQQQQQQQLQQRKAPLPQKVQQLLKAQSLRVAKSIHVVNMANALHYVDDSHASVMIIGSVDYVINKSMSVSPLFPIHSINTKFFPLWSVTTPALSLDQVKNESDSEQTFSLPVYTKEDSKYIFYGLKGDKISNFVPVQKRMMDPKEVEEENKQSIPSEKVASFNMVPERLSKDDMK